MTIGCMMKVYTNGVSYWDMLKLTEGLPGVYIDVRKDGTPRDKTFDKFYDFLLTGNSRRRPNGGNVGAGDDYAATWDEWGVVLGRLFRLDPNAKCWAYDGVNDFDYKTAYRFDEDGLPEDAHGDHRWDFKAPSVRACKKCSAEQRWM